MLQIPKKIYFENWDLFRLIRIIRNSSLVIIFIFLILPLFFPICVRAVSNPFSYPITISATIGEPKLRVFGWTSPLSYLEMRGQGVLEGVISQKNGYFLFERVFLPRANPQYPEICLTVIDRQSRISSFPTCLPPLPTGPFEITIGPILLPPTLSLERGIFLPDEQVVARGATIPRSKVMIFFANDEIAALKEKRAHNRAAYAYSLPEYEIFADENGNFELNLPTGGKPANWRIFAATEYLNSPSPKSHTLTFKILSWWAWFWQKIKTLLITIGSFKPNWWLLIIAGELLLITYLFRRRTKKSKLNSSEKLILPAGVKPRFPLLPPLNTLRE